MEGYREMFTDLKNWLRSITGFSGVSLQPNAGAQGEYAGLMVIRKYHLDREEENRNICLIPSSAHGTNPASAQMVGMKVVVVNCDKEGNVDFEDLKKKAEQHSENLGALMVTYPSTHGVFEEKIKDICDLIHEHGGQVYMDGANLNALVGVAKPEILVQTFVILICIKHFVFHMVEEDLEWAPLLVKNICKFICLIIQ